MSYTPDTTEEEGEEDDVNQILESNFNGELGGGGDVQIGVEDEIAKLPEIDAGGYVVGLYEGEYYLGEPVQDQTGVLPGYKKISFMKIRGSNQFGWDKPDIFDLPIPDILLDKVEPIPVNNRGHLGLTKDDLKIVKTLMVVLYSILFIPFIYFCLKGEFANFFYWLI